MEIQPKVMQTKRTKINCKNVMSCCIKMKKNDTT